MRNEGHNGKGDYCKSCNLNYTKDNSQYLEYPVCKMCACKIHISIQAEVVASGMMEDAEHDCIGCKHLQNKFCTFWGRLVSPKEPKVCSRHEVNYASA